MGLASLAPLSNEYPEGEVWELLAALGSKKSFWAADLAGDIFVIPQNIASRPLWSLQNLRVYGLR